ncbi:Aste57867_11925 [Aphanomyces stellatus]|uniref:Aste57867_11925 protein n=1 Tax=Aphanomyces stellatus TaxID=120398 RepID=A0A485KUA1_9STRA|nr:hypothetical protein As57867_011880 [Aphanomyces stellatus]VFT88780.1 Aste57867_11925 [Aphanomyces stellatus]
MAGDHHKKRQSVAMPSVHVEPMKEARGNRHTSSVPNLAPLPLMDSRHEPTNGQQPKKVHADAAAAHSSSATTLPPAGRPSTTQSGANDQGEKSAKLPPAAVKRHKSILQVSRTRRSGDIVLETDRTIDLVQKYQLGQAELKKLKEAFNHVDMDRAGTIDYDEFFEFIDETRTPFCDKFLKMIDINGDGVIDFEEFVHALTTYCMYTRDEILKFAFECFDTDESGSIDEMEFKIMAGMINDGSPLFRINYEKAMHDFDKNNDGVLDFDEFQLLNKRYPMLFFPCFRMQEAMQKATLGVAHWLRLHERYFEVLKEDAYRKRHAGAAPPIPTSTKIKLIFGIGTFEVYQPD